MIGLFIADGLHCGIGPVDYFDNAIVIFLINFNTVFTRV